MNDPLEIPPVAGPVRGRIRPPGSKSITNRALIVAALAEGSSTLTGVLDSRDTEVMIESLNRLGISVAHDKSKRTVTITGCNGHPPAKAADLWLENSGTSIRFLTALCALGNGRYRLDGNERMRERPIADLVDALRELGADITLENDTDSPPLVVHANGLAGGTTTVAGNISSQYLSALLMAAPAAKGPIEIQIAGELVSVPYVNMTLAVMESFGIQLDTTPDNQAPSPPQPAPTNTERVIGGEGRGEGATLNRRFRITPQNYSARTYAIEPDASAASYFFAAAAITRGSVTVEGLSRNALQGDVAFVDVLEQMGCRVETEPQAITIYGGNLCGVDVDMNAISDTAQTLAAVAVFADGPTRIRNIAHVRHKETDRIAAVATELQRLGVTVEEHPDGLTIIPPLHKGVTPATIQTYDDHRMAMSFALIGLRVPGVKIADPGCTAKTYPNYFDDLFSLCQS